MFKGLRKDINQRFDEGDRLEALLQQARSDGGDAYDDKEPGKLRVDSFTATSGEVGDTHTKNNRIEQGSRRKIL